MKTKPRTIVLNALSGFTLVAAITGFVLMRFWFAHHSEPLLWSLVGTFAAVVASAAILIRELFWGKIEILD